MPANYTLEAIVWAGAGVTSAVRAYGGGLLKAHGKDTTQFPRYHCHCAHLIHLPLYCLRCWQDAKKPLAKAPYPP